MKILLSVFLVLPLAMAAASAADEKIYPFEYQKVELDNGFKAYLIRAGAPGQIAYVTIVRTGSREEWEPGRSGFAHFFEHIMFRGTERYPAFDDVITKIGGDSNAFTSDDQTVYHIVASTDSLAQLVDLESDRFMNLSYTEPAFRTEAGAVLGEFNQGRANPFLYLIEKMRDTAFDKHTYKHLTIGFEQDVRAMPEGFDYSRSFFERYYRPENCILLLAGGDFDFGQAEELIRQHYGPWKPGYTAPQIEAEPPQTAARQASAEFPGQTLPILAVNYKGPAWNATDKMAVATEVLGQVAFGQNSDIYKKLVIQDQKLQAFFGDFEPPRDPGLLSVLAMVINPDDLESVQGEIEGTVQKYRSELCDAKKLEETKSAIKYGFLMGLETARSAAFALISVVTNTGALEPVEDYFKTLDSITPEDIQAAARKYLVEKGRTTVTLFPKGGSRPAASDEASGETVTLPEAGSPFVAFNIWFKVGSQNDPAGKEGLASLTAALLDDGSTNQDSYEQILAKLYPMSAFYGSSVDKEMTVFRGVVHKDNLEGYYTLFKNAILSPAFKEEDFKRIKTQTLNFLKRQRRFSSDEELGKELLFRQIFKGTPYEHPEEGYVQSVDSITLDDVKSFYAGHYRRNAAVVGLGGGYPEGFVQRVRGDLNRLPPGGATAVPAPQPRPIEGRHVLIVEKDTNATAISMGYPIPLLRSHDDFYAAMLVNSWLGEHRSSASHLYQVIRERRGMNYGDYSYIEAYPMGHTISMPPQNVARRQQIFQIWIRPISMLQPGDMHDRSLFATRAALREVARLVEQGMDADEFSTRVDFLKNYAVNFGSTISRRLGYRMDDAFYAIPAQGHLNLIRPELEKLTQEAVDQSIRKYLQIDNMWMVFITKNAEGLKQKLISGEPSPIRYPGEKPAELLEEDKLIQAYSLQIPEQNIHIVDVNEVLEK